jgi:hypothetical protein
MRGDPPGLLPLMSMTKERPMADDLIAEIAALKGQLEIAQANAIEAMKQRDEARDELRYLKRQIAGMGTQANEPELFDELRKKSRE